MITKHAGSKSATRQLHISPSHTRFQLQEVSPSAKATTAPALVASSTGDPTGIKAYIAFSIAYSLYPQGNGVNPDQDISDNAKLNSDVIAATINKDALKSAKPHQLTWKLVTADQIAKLSTVRDMMNQIVGNLTALAQGTGT